MSDKEPRILQEGKRFHKVIQDDWRETAEGELFFEKTMDLTTDKKGRMDIFVRESGAYVAIGEIKNTDWDSMTKASVKRNIKRQVRQIWSYIHSQLRSSKDVTPGVIFPRKPSDQDRLELIEALFEAEGISVVWNDETPASRKRRSDQSIDRLFEFSTFH